LLRWHGRKMGGHFSYKHLPAIGLGKRDPRRPYVAGGLGAGVPIFITRIDGKREPIEGVQRTGTGPPRVPIYGIDYDVIPDLERDPQPELGRDIERRIMRGPDPGVWTTVRSCPSADYQILGTVTDSTGDGDGEMWNDLNKPGPYITADFGGNAWVDLAPIKEPPVRTGHRLMVRQRGSQYNLISLYGWFFFALVDDHSNIFFETERIPNPHTFPGEYPWTDMIWEIPEADAEQITDYSKLSVIAAFQKGTFGGAWPLDLDYVCLEVSYYDPLKRRPKREMKRELLDETDTENYAEFSGEEIEDGT